MFFRSLALVALFLGIVGSHQVEARPSDPDGSAVQGAAQRLGHQSNVRVLAWLRLQISVKRASIGRDGRSVEIAFRDGAHAVILPPAVTAARFTVSGPPRFLRTAIRQLAPAGARALVLEPFATELHLPPGAGSGEASDLTAAGFRVDGPLTDAAVTPGTMSTLAQYNVVYMHTHTGVDQNGSGVLATGELASCTPYTSADGTIATVGVAGSTQCFHAITAAFVQKDVGQFPANAIVYVNGCDLLDAADFLQVFSAHGVGVTLSWNGEATGFDGYLSSLALFNQLGQGATISQALTTLYENHYGTSQVQGQTAMLGFKGNGAITLQVAASGGAGAGVTPTVMPMPSDTPVATETPLPAAPTVTASPTSAPPFTQTPVPTATAIPATATSTALPTTGPLPALVSVLPAVKPGNQETLAVKNVKPGSVNRLSVQLPNGDQLTSTSSADAGGTVTFSFAQAASKITRHNQNAILTITGAGNSGSFTLHGTYHIDFGHIDVSVQPRVLPAGHTMTVWIHAGRRTAVTALLKLPRGRRLRLHGRTGTKGWLELVHRLDRTLQHGETIVVRGDYVVGHKQWHSATTVRIA